MPDTSSFIWWAVTVRPGGSPRSRAAHWPRPAEAGLGQCAALDRGLPPGLTVTAHHMKLEVSGILEGAGDLCAGSAASIDPGADHALWLHVVEVAHQLSSVGCGE